MNKINTTISTFAVTGLMALALVFGFTNNAEAATYAYVSNTGNVRSVIADTWMNALNTAPSIHIHSGVLLLKTAADYGIVGDTQ